MWDVLFAVWADKAMWGSERVKRLEANGGQMQDLRGTRINEILLNKMLKNALVSSCSRILLNALSSCCSRDCI